MPFDAISDLSHLSNIEILALAESRPGASVLLRLAAIIMLRIADRDMAAAAAVGAPALVLTAEPVEVEAPAVAEVEVAPVEDMGPALDLPEPAPKPRKARAPRAAKAPVDHAALMRRNRKIRKDALNTPVQHSFGPAWVGMTNPLLECRTAAMRARYGAPVRGDAGYETFRGNGAVYAVSLYTAGVWTIEGADWTLWTRDDRHTLTMEGRGLVEARMAEEAAKAAADEAARKAKRKAEVEAERLAREILGNHPVRGLRWHVQANAIASTMSWQAGDFTVALVGDGTVTVLENGEWETFGEARAVAEPVAA
jgi:hypothetical protein